MTRLWQHWHRKHTVIQMTVPYKKYSIATTDITPVGLNFKAGKAYSKAQFDNIKIYTVKISDE